MSDKALWDSYVEAEKTIVALKDKIGEMQFLLARAEQYVATAAGSGDETAVELLEEIVGTYTTADRESASNG